MKILMLDFDGVIIPEQAYLYWNGRSDRKRKNPELSRAARSCPICISNLNYVCTQVPDLKIVISSTWRKYFDLVQLKEVLEEDGFKFCDLIVGITPSIPRGLSDLNGRRGTEIQAWLDEYKEAEVIDWVAIDDHKYNIPVDRLVHTQQEVGFTLLQAYSLIERFNSEWERPLFVM